MPHFPCLIRGTGQQAPFQRQSSGLPVDLMRFSSVQSDVWVSCSPHAPEAIVQSSITRKKPGLNSQANRQHLCSSHFPPVNSRLSKGACTCARRFTWDISTATGQSENRLVWIKMWRTARGICSEDWRGNSVCFFVRCVFPSQGSVSGGVHAVGATRSACRYRSWWS